MILPAGLLVCKTIVQEAQQSSLLPKSRKPTHTMNFKKSSASIKVLEVYYRSGVSQSEGEQGILFFMPRFVQGLGNVRL